MGKVYEGNDVISPV